MPPEGLLPVPDDLDRTPNATFIQEVGDQRQEVLHRHVLAAAKCAARRGIDHAYLLGGQIEHVRDLVLVIVVPLPCRVHRNPALLVDEADTGLWLQIGMLLVRGVVIRLDDNYVVACKDSVDVALANTLMALHVVGPHLLDHGRARLHRLARVGHHRKGLVLHPDQVPGLPGGALGLGDHQRHTVKH